MLSVVQSPREVFMKKITFYYVRHGQTYFNEARRLQGWCDSPLTAKGIQDARDAKEALKNIPFTKAYCSSSERCRDTADIILEGRNIPCVSAKNLKEMHFGSFEGCYMPDHLDVIDPIRFGTYDWTQYGGENTELLANRIKGYLDEIAEESKDGDTILIVSHGAVFFQMIYFLFGYSRRVYQELMFKEPREYRPVPNGFAAIFTYEDGKYELIELEKRSKEFLETLKKTRHI